MKPEVDPDQNLTETLKSLQEQLAAVNDRLAVLESEATPPASGSLAGGGTPKPAPSSAVPASEPLSDELLLVLSAAIAAYIGKRPRIRQVRLVSSTTWAQQGRVGIHTSHAFPVLSRSGATS